MKNLFFVLFLLLSVCVTNAQIYTKPNNSYGTKENRREVDSTLFFPTGCGVPTNSTWLFSYGSLGSGEKKAMAALYYDSCGHHGYFWDPSLQSWLLVGSGAGGGKNADSIRSVRVDTGSVLRDGYVLTFDSAARRFVFAKPASGGGGGSTDTTNISFRLDTIGNRYISSGAGDVAITGPGVATTVINNGVVTLAKMATGPPTYHLEYNGSGNLTAVPPVNLNVTKFGATSDDSLSFLRNDTLFNIGFRDSADHHHYKNQDGSRTFWIEAHDSTSANALQTKYRSDTSRTTLYFQLGQRIINGGNANKIIANPISLRPSASACVGCFYGATDSLSWSYSNGTTWISLGGGGGGGTTGAFVGYGSIASLQASTGTPAAGATYSFTDKFKQGLAVYDSTDTASSDDGATIFVTAGGARYKRIIDHEANIQWWPNVIGDGSTNSTTGIQAALDWIANNSTGIHSLYWPSGTTGNYMVDTITFKGGIIRGDNMRTRISPNTSTRKYMIGIAVGVVDKWSFSNFEFINTANPTQGCINFFAQSQAGSPFNGGSWHLTSNNIQIQNFGSNEVNFYASDGAGDVVNQFSDFNNWRIFNNNTTDTTIRGIKIVGQFAQINFNYLEMYGPGKTIAGSVGIEDQSLLTSNDQTQGAVNIYRPTLQAYHRAGKFSYAQGVNIDGGWFENDSICIYALNKSRLNIERNVFKNCQSIINNDLSITNFNFNGLYGSIQKIYTSPSGQPGGGTMIGNYFTDNGQWTSTYQTPQITIGSNTIGPNQFTDVIIPTNLATNQYINTINSNLAPGEQLHITARDVAGGTNGAIELTSIGGGNVNVSAFSPNGMQVLRDKMGVTLTKGDAPNTWKVVGLNAPPVFMTALPTTGVWFAGDAIYMQNPVHGGVFAYVCTGTGTFTGTAPTFDSVMMAGASGGGSGLVYPNTIKKYLNGYGTFATLNTDSINEGSSNLFFTQSRARSSVSGVAPITYNSTTGAIGADTTHTANSLATYSNIRDTAAAIRGLSPWPVETPLGTFYDKSVWLNTNDLVANTSGGGTAALTLDSNYIDVQASNINFNSYARILPWRPTQLPRFTIEVKYSILDALAAGTTGIGFGVKSANINGATGDFICYQNTTTGGTNGYLNLVSADGAHNYPSSSSTTNIVHQRDIMKMVIIYTDSLVTVLDSNLTTGTVSTPLTWTNTIASTLGPVFTLCNFCVTAFGPAKYRLYGIKLSSDVPRNMNNLHLADSKGGFKADTYNKRLFWQLNSAYPSSVMWAGGSNTISDALLAQDELLSLNGENLYIALGSNDKRFGGFNGTLENRIRNYRALVAKLTIPGRTIYHICYPEDSTGGASGGGVGMKEWDLFLRAEYGPLYINKIWDSLSTGNVLKSGFNSGDGVHPNQAAYNAAYTIITGYNYIHTINTNRRGPYIPGDASVKLNGANITVYPTDRATNYVNHWNKDGSSGTGILQDNGIQAGASKAPIVPMTGADFTGNTIAVTPINTSTGFGFATADQNTPGDQTFLIYGANRRLNIFASHGGANVFSQDTIGRLALGKDVTGAGPTAYLYLNNGTSVVGHAPIKYFLRNSVLLAVPEAGAEEADNFNSRYYTDSTGLRHKYAFLDNAVFTGIIVPNQTALTSNTTAANTSYVDLAVAANNSRFWSNIVASSGSTLTPAGATINYKINPSATIATYVIDLGGGAFPDGQIVKLHFGGTVTSGNTVVTSLTIQATSRTIVQATTPTTALSGDCLIYIYDASTSTFYREK